MISRISKLDFGIFHDFTWPDRKEPSSFKKFKEPSSFKKFNLIYGWNRSGKTTVSRVFASCEKKNAGGEGEIRRYPKNGKFTIKTSDGKTIEHTDVNCAVPIRVFNQDFVEENISFDPSDPCKPIVYVSKQDIEMEKRLKQLKDDQAKLDGSYEQSEKEHASAEKTLDTFLIGIGRQIKDAIGGRYDKRNVKQRIEDDINIDNCGNKILSNEDKDDCKETISSNKKEGGRSEIKKHCFLDNKTIDNFQKIFEKVGVLLDKKVVSETLDRLKNDKALNNWVQQGFDLHNEKKEKEKCLFCQAPLAGGFLDKLSRHFSQDYEELQSTINRLRNEISEIKLSEEETSNSDLYPNLQSKYKAKMNELNECAKKINARIDEATAALQKKHDDVFAVIPKPTQPDDFLTSYNRAIAELNKIISKHNKKADGHKDTVSDAKKNLNCTISRLL